MLWTKCQKTIIKLTRIENKRNQNAKITNFRLKNYNLNKLIETQAKHGWGAIRKNSISKFNSLELLEKN